MIGAPPLACQLLAYGRSVGAVYGLDLEAMTIHQLHHIGLCTGDVIEADHTVGVGQVLLDNDAIGKQRVGFILVARLPGCPGNELTTMLIW